LQRTQPWKGYALVTVIVLHEGASIEQQGVAYAQTIAGALNLKLDTDNPADREKLRRAVSILSPGESIRLADKLGPRVVWRMLVSSARQRYRRRYGENALTKSKLSSRQIRVAGSRPRKSNRVWSI
jgi:hypothetical protein